MTTSPSVVYVLPDKMGGMTNIIANLLAHRRPDAFSHHVVFTHNHLHHDTRANASLAADSQTLVEYTLPVENLHAVLRRLVRAVPAGEGVYLAGDLLDLAAASIHDFRRAVVYMLHGDSEYYYDLAVKHDPVVHAFIAYSRRMHQQLLARLPHRAESIFYLPYGIPLPLCPRASAVGPLRAIYAGRLEHQQKGIFDLPEIDCRLRDAGVEVAWTVAGAGPDEAQLRERWAFNREVRWLGRVDTEELLTRYVDQDVFVLPTRVEGFPLALLEAMGAGLVPVVSDIPSGIPEIVEDRASGRRVPVGDVDAFAQAIVELARDRASLEGQSRVARLVVGSRFDIRERVGDYHALFVRWRALYRPLDRGGHLQYGSRLDRTWMPNPFVRFVRTALRTAR